MEILRPQYFASLGRHDRLHPCACRINPGRHTRRTAFAIFRPSRRWLAAFILGLSFDGAHFLVYFFNYLPPDFTPTLNFNDTDCSPSLYQQVYLTSLPPRTPFPSRFIYGPAEVITSPPSLRNINPHLFCTMQFW